MSTTAIDPVTSTIATLRPIETKEHTDDESTQLNRCRVSYRLGAYYYIAKLFKWQIIYSYIEMNFHSLYIFLLPGYGLKWLCGWNFNIFYWIAATFGVVFIMILCHIPRKVIVICLQLFIDLCSNNRNLKIYDFFFLFTGR